MMAPSFQAMRTGGCQCGAVRYELHGAVLKLYVCHCRECRKQSASAFGVSLFVARDSLRLVRGTPKWWSRATDSGKVLECAFCPDCGSRLWHRWQGDEALVSVKGGSLDEAVDLGAAVHIWTSRRCPGLVIPETAIQFATAPEG